MAQSDSDRTCTLACTESAHVGMGAFDARKARRICGPKSVSPRGKDRREASRTESGKDQYAESAVAQGKARSRRKTGSDGVTTHGAAQGSSVLVSTHFQNALAYIMFFLSWCSVGTLAFCPWATANAASPSGTHLRGNGQAYRHCPNLVRISPPPASTAFQS